MASRLHPEETLEVEALRAAAPLAQCSPEAFTRLKAIARGFTLAPGSALLPERQGETIAFITGGSAKLVAPGTPKGHILAFQFPGDIVSIAHRPDGSATLVALSEVELVTFIAHEFLDAAEDDTALLRAVLVRSLETIQRNRTRMMRLGHRSARERIAGFLVTMAERICGCSGGSCEFALPMGRGDIGDSLGLAIETVSRQFTELRNEGLVTTRGRAMVHLSDVEVLRREAGP